MQPDREQGERRPVAAWRLTAAAPDTDSRLHAVAACLLRLPSTKFGGMHGDS